VAPAPKFTLWTLSDLAARPRPEWLFEGLLQQRVVAVLYGEPGIGKSFVALDLALAVATGTTGIAQPLATGLVVYIAAEGATGIINRAEAWLSYHDAADNDQFLVVEDPVRLAEDLHVVGIINSLEQIGSPPVLVVVDTLARCMSGREENNPSDMSRFIDGADKIRKKFGCAVLILHHPTKSDPRVARGGSSLDGDTDTMMHLASNKAGLLTLHCMKQKDAAEFEPIEMTLEIVELEHVASSSCVVLRYDSDTRVKPLADKGLDILRALTDEPQLRWSDLMNRSGVRGGSFDRYLKVLLKDGYLEQADNCYTLTPKGAMAIGLPPPPSNPHETPMGVAPSDTATSTTPTPLGGGGWWAVVGPTNDDHAPTNTTPTPRAGPRQSAPHSGIPAGGKSGDIACKMSPTAPRTEESDLETASIDDLCNLFGGAK
jgi:predicted transcriptional regulator